MVPVMLMLLVDDGPMPMMSYLDFSDDTQLGVAASVSVYVVRRMGNRMISMG